MIATSFSAHAEISSLIGKIVDGEFTININGKELNQKAIVIKGTSYLPVRSISESIGYNVKFDEGTGIELFPKDDQTTLPIKYVPWVHIGNADKYNGDFYYFEKDGNQYVSVNCLIDPYSIYWLGESKGGIFHLKEDGQKASVQTSTSYTKTTNDVMVNYTKDYEKNTDSFKYKYTESIFVQLSTLGLKAEFKFNPDAEINDYQLFIFKDTNVPK